MSPAYCCRKLDFSVQDRPDSRLLTSTTPLVTQHGRRDTSMKLKKIEICGRLAFSTFHYENIESMLTQAAYYLESLVVLLGCLVIKLEID